MESSADWDDQKIQQFNLGQKKIRACYTALPKEITELHNELHDVFNSGTITCFAKYVNRLERQLCHLLHVKHVLTVSNGSTGMDILLSTLPKNSEVLVPSFTFPATVHAIVHNHLKPIFLDIERETYNVCIEAARAKITKNTSAILPVNVFGSPSRIQELEAMANQYHVKLFFDSAAAIGSKYGGRLLGQFGHAEVFSMSGTKVVTAGEGGVITTNDDDLAKELECRRNYGYSKIEKDCLYAGFNGKLNELSALIAIWSLRDMEHNIAKRHIIAKVYYEKLEKIPGIHFQKILEGCETNFCTFAIEIDCDEFGMNASELLNLLNEQNIETLRYFYPPMHKTRAYRQYNGLQLKHTEDLSERVLCLPMHSQLTIEQTNRVCSAIQRIHDGAPKALRRQRGSLQKQKKRPDAEFTLDITLPKY